MRVYYYSFLSDFNQNQINNYSTTTDYITMDKQYEILDTIIFLINANFLIFVFVYVNNLKIFNNEFDIIQRNLAEVNLIKSNKFIIFNFFIF